MKAERLAASSELLSVLQAVATRHEWTPGLGPCVCHAHVAARALINKLAPAEVVTDADLKNQEDIGRAT